MLTSAHGAIPHNHDGNHQHEEHNHEHPSHDHSHSGNHLIQVSHGIFHSVVHFIENLSHSHDASDEPIIVENANLSHQVGVATLIFFAKEVIIEYSPKCYSSESACRYSKLYLINSSLRGPPSIV